MLSSAWGPFDLDAFAADTNNRVSAFFSKLYSEKAAGINAFAQSWEGLHLWLCPPVAAVHDVLVKMAASEDASGVLVVPHWRLANFWLTLVPDGKHFCKGVVNYSSFSPKWYSGEAVTSRMFRGVKSWKTLALFLDSNVEDFLEPNYSRSFCLSEGCAFCD